MTNITIVLIAILLIAFFAVEVETVKDLEEKEKALNDDKKLNMGICPECGCLSIETITEVIGNSGSFAQDNQIVKYMCTNKNCSFED